MSLEIICYPDGTDVRVGDVVRVHGDTLIVEEVITESRMMHFGVDAPGLMLVGIPFGGLFVSVSDFQDEDGGVFFVRRHE